MMEVHVRLEFTCVGCKQCVGVTVQCQGDDLPRAGDKGMRVSVPCPTCSQVNRLVFGQNGQVHSVQSSPSIRSFVEPSLN
jgi:phage terminase large subunit GpA-like protein